MAKLITLVRRQDHVSDVLLAIVSSPDPEVGRLEQSDEECRWDDAEAAGFAASVVRRHLPCLVSGGLDADDPMPIGLGLRFDRTPGEAFLVVCELARLVRAAKEA